MPTYEYSCNYCGNLFEELQNILSEPVANCPSCSSKAKRLISKNVNFVFKGPGFYTTEYRSEDYKKKVKEEKEPAKEVKKEDEKKK
ncbi:MAG: zinc ribbon domain-containing protein [bacterium]|nr:zinc ribbon domain-containing protein [bacterium]